MKMVIISLSILLLFIGIWAWFYFISVDPVTNYFWENLVTLSELVENEDWESAKADISLYTDKWYETKGLWIYFLNQKDLDSIDSSIRQLNIFIDNEEKILAQAEIEHLIVLFYIIDENECLSLENIF